jgi:cytochrome d ubiquinol oxidase subunit I
VVFWAAVLVLFWMCQRGQQPAMGEEFHAEQAPLLSPVPSQET